MANEALSALAPATVPVMDMGARFAAQEMPGQSNHTANQKKALSEESSQTRAVTSTAASPTETAQTLQPTGNKPDTSLKDLEKAVKKLNDSLGISPRNLSFSIDKDTEKVVVKVIDGDTKEVIKQIPPDEILAITKALDKLQGMLVEEKA